ncbi:MAG: hypothetical protein MI746_02505 [Pseudomonadales bacterium]|nr:hypothetical protein [Pseudomonadales bacterium]
MSQFEYVSVLVSIVLALGMGEIMICWARMIQQRERIQFSALHLFWSVFIMLLMVQFWWGFWQFSVITDWSMFDLIHILVETAALVIGALIMLPGRQIPADLDLEEFYFKHHRVFFGLAMVMVSSLITADIFILQIPIADPENIIRATALILLIPPLVSDNRKLHYSLGLAYFLLLTAFVMV